MNKVFKILYYWLPPFVWMGVIFYFSSKQKVGVADEYVVNFIFFKTLHLIEYAALYFLLFRAFQSSTVHKFTLKQSLIYPIIFAIMFAISDEIHQTFVPTREGHPRDVIIDTIGILLCFSYTKNNLHFLKLFL